MKRSRLLFTAVVFGALTFGIVREQRQRDAPIAAYPFSTGRRPTFDALELPVGDHVLRGSVLDHAGEPAAGVQVLLFRSEALPDRAEPLAVAFTDGQGRFELDELFATDYGVVLAIHGVQPRTERITLPETPLVTEASWSLTPPLEPLEVLPEIERAELVGRVALPRPQSAIPVDLQGYEVVIRPGPSNHPLSGAVIRRTRSDEQGGFRFEGLVAAEYRLELLPEWARGGSWPVLDTLELTHALGVDPEPTLWIRTGSIEGRLVDLDQRPVEGALIKTWPEEDAHRIWPPAQSGAGGRFTLSDLPAGRYRVRVRAGATVREVSVDVREGTIEKLAFEPLDLHPPTRPQSP